MQIYLLLTQKCNLSCSFCIRGKAKDSYLDVSHLKKILEENDFSKYQLLLTGGEPTLHKQLNEIIELTHPHFKSICINTNGTNSTWLDKLINRNIHIQISLDGTEEMHNQLRIQDKKNIFSAIQETIRKIEMLNIPYNLSTTISTANLCDIQELAQYICQFQKMAYWKISPQLPFGCGGFDTHIDTGTWNSLVEDLLNTVTVRMHIKKLFDFSIIKKYQDQIPKNILSNCGSAKTKFYIYPDFTVYPCTCLTNFPLGNLKNQTLEEIQKTEYTKLFSSYSVDLTSTCANCEYLKFCNGGCIGMSYHYFGKLGMGDCRCPLVKK